MSLLNLVDADLICSPEFRDYIRKSESIDILDACDKHAIDLCQLFRRHVPIEFDRTCAIDSTRGDALNGLPLWRLDASLLVQYLFQSGTRLSFNQVLELTDKLHVSDTLDMLDESSNSHILLRCSAWALFSVIFQGYCHAHLQHPSSDTVVDFGLLIRKALKALAPPHQFSPQWSAGSTDSEEGNVSAQELEARSSLMKQFSRFAERVWLVLAFTTSLILHNASLPPSAKPRHLSDIDWPLSLTATLAPIVLLITAYSTPMRTSWPQSESSPLLLSAFSLDAWRSTLCSQLSGAVAQRLVAIGLIQSPHWPKHQSGSGAAACPLFIVASAIELGSDTSSVFSRFAPLSALLRWASVLVPTCRLIRTMLLHGLVRAGSHGTSDFLLRDEAPWKSHPYLRRVFGVIVDSIQTLSPDDLVPSMQSANSEHFRAVRDLLPTEPPVSSAISDLIPSLLLLIDDEESAANQSLGMRACSRVLIHLAGGASDSSTWFRPLLIRSLQRLITTALRHREKDDAYFRDFDVFSDQPMPDLPSPSDSALRDAFKGSSRKVLLEALRECVLTCAFCVCTPPVLAPSGGADDFMSLFTSISHELEYACLSIGDASLDMIDIVGDTLVRMLEGLGPVRLSQQLAALLQIVTSLLLTEESPRPTGDLVCLPLALRIVRTAAATVPDRICAHKLVLLHAFANLHARAVLRQEHSVPNFRKAQFMSAMNQVSKQSDAAAAFVIDLCRSDERHVEELRAVVAEMLQSPVNDELRSFFHHCSKLLA